MLRTAPVPVPVLAILALALVACGSSNDGSGGGGSSATWFGGGGGAGGAGTAGTGGTGGTGGTAAPLSLTSTTDTITLAATHTVAVGPALDMIALTDGWVILPDRGANQVRYQNVVSQQVAYAYQLSAPPGDLEYDGASGVLFVALSGANAIARIDVVGGSLSLIAVNDSATNLALGDGKLFAALDDATTWPDRTIVVIDAATGAIEANLTDDYDPLIVYDAGGDQLIAGARGSSPSSLTRFAFDAQARTLTLTEERWNAGTNGQDLAVSPDGDHVAFPCGGGNGAGYTIYDFSADDLAVSYGEWDTGAYPRAAAFSETGTHLVASNGYDLMLFDVSSHAKLAEHRIDVGQCSYATVEQVAFSRGGRIMYCLMTCGYDDDSGQLVAIPTGL